VKRNLSVIICSLSFPVFRWEHGHRKQFGTFGAKLGGTRLTVEILYFFCLREV